MGTGCSVLVILAIAAGVCVAVTLGNGDAANAAGALLATRSASRPAAVAWSIGWHVLGGLLGGSAVAAAVAALVRVPPGRLPGVLLAGSLASIAFCRLAVRRGLPVSASHGLFAGLAGAAIVVGGVGAVKWGGLSGLRPTGMLAVATALAVSPAAGLAAAALVRSGLGRVAGALPRRAARPVRAAMWVGAAAVAVADGSNDGQKAMGIMAAALAVGGHRSSPDVAGWVRLAAATALAAGTAVGGRRVLRSVSRQLYHMDLIDGVAVQVSSAAVILLSSAFAAPLSTSSVAASSVLGAGATRRPAHVKWGVAFEMVAAWAVTVPVCLVAGAGLAAMGHWL
jgi:PiT family inorganic phosphate transporter